jgi:hypothetical protein
LILAYRSNSDAYGLRTVRILYALLYHAEIGSIDRAADCYGDTPAVRRYFWAVRIANARLVANQISDLLAVLIRSVASLSSFAVRIYGAGHAAPAHISAIAVRVLPTYVPIPRTCHVGLVGAVIAAIYDIAPCEECREGNQ